MSTSVAPVFALIKLRNIWFIPCVGSQYVLDETPQTAHTLFVVRLWHIRYTMHALTAAKTANQLIRQRKRLMSPVAARLSLNPNEYRPLAKNTLG
jgi:hypothetical protein